MSAAGYSSQRGSNFQSTPLRSYRLGCVLLPSDCLCRDPRSIFLFTERSCTGCSGLTSNWSDSLLLARLTWPTMNHFERLTPPIFVSRQGRRAPEKEYFSDIRPLSTGWRPRTKHSRLRLPIVSGSGYRWPIISWFRYSFIYREEPR